jgi:hypothetical protein
MRQKLPQGKPASWSLDHSRRPLVDHGRLTQLARRQSEKSV